AIVSTAAWYRPWYSASEAARIRVVLVKISIARWTRGVVSRIMRRASAAGRRRLEPQVELERFRHPQRPAERSEGAQAELAVPEPEPRLDLQAVAVERQRRRHLQGNDPAPET